MTPYSPHNRPVPRALTYVTLPSGAAVQLEPGERPCYAHTKKHNAHAVLKGWLCTDHVHDRKKKYREMLIARGWRSVLTSIGNVRITTLTEHGIPYRMFRTATATGSLRGPYGREAWVDSATGELLHAWVNTPAIRDEIPLHGYLRDVIAPLYRKAAP